MNCNLTFDEENHIYRVNGVIKRSVTQVFKDVGICNYSGLDPYYADRGTRAHYACDLSARGWVSSDDVEEDIQGYVKTFERICFELGLTYISSEVACYDPGYQCHCCGRVYSRSECVPELFNGYIMSKCCGAVIKEGYDVCGTYDLIMGWQGKKMLVELKTGPFEMYHGLQLAWYERMVDVDDVLGISLKDGGKVFGKAPDWQKNHDVLKDIHTGFFDHAKWYKDKKRRRMVRIDK